MDRREFRSHVSRENGADDLQVAELLAYNENVFSLAHDKSVPSFPLTDELFASTWEEYAAASKRGQTFDFLRSRLIQFRFPIEAGISQTEEYQLAVRRGKEPNRHSGFNLESPDLFRLEIHPSAAGRIPLLLFANRNDFVACVRALTKRNEPVFIPDSMGACMVAGYNNWDRVRQLRRDFEAGLGRQDEEAWNREFQKIAGDRNLYQDRFILLSDSFYSGVPPEAMHLTEADWRKASLIIRREHECAHYFTKRVFNCMRNNLFDELLADYMGIVTAAGHFRADWFLRFMGLETNTYRTGARFENYRGDPPLSEGSLQILQQLLRRAAQELENFSIESKLNPADPDDFAGIIFSIGACTMEELASADALRLLKQNLRSANQSTPKLSFQESRT